MRRREFITLFGGAAAAWPLAARAQQAAMPLIGFLSSRSPGELPHLLTAFGQGLYERGYVEGRNVMIEYRWGEGRYDRLSSLANELVQRRAAAIIAIALPAAVAAKAATKTIPILFFSGVDPVKAGLVASFNRPGSNLTGVSLVITELEAKRLELLRDLVPKVLVVSVLTNPSNPNTEVETEALVLATRALGLQMHIVKATSEGEIEAVFAAFAHQRPDALMIGSDPFFLSRHNQLVTLAATHAIPTMFFAREFVTAGGLISYGASLVNAFHELGAYAGKILSGAKPGELPVLQPTKFELIINLKTAKVLGLTVPPTLLARADEVIE
jgi:putative ABC transport system substrate-binding protein